jgi:hypothetical protein
MHIKAEDLSLREISTSFEILRSVRHDMESLLENPHIHGLGRDEPLLSASLKSLDTPRSSRREPTF